mgnify:FL=1|tara:strand:+ start:139 stop:1785 length:1647 start_codon:yes stop_codon:yes gene_type:complete
MLNAIFSNYLILTVILGYSLFLKKIFFVKNEITIKNIDLLYGLTLLIFISLFLNFFFPLKFFVHTVFVLGFLLFIYGLYKKFFDINFILYFFIIFFTTYVSFYSIYNIDSPMYHLQIIKWLSFHKISFGLSNLEIRLGFNSSWHSLLALLDLNIYKFTAKYYISSIILSAAIYETIRYKIKLNYSDIFLYLAISFLIFFSYLHPFKNGVILNHLGNPERDIVNMIFFFLIIYFFLKIRENQNNKNYINLLFLSLFLCLTSRMLMLPMIILLIYTLIENKNYKIINLSTIFLFIVSIFWVSRTFILSGCLFFPFYQTCFKTSWSVNVEEVKFFVEEAMRISRTLPTRNGVNDVDFSLNSYNWVGQWINDYFFSAALLQAGSIIIIFTASLLLILKFINKFKSIFEKSDLIILASLIITMLLWFNAPETRYGLGLLISLPCFFIILLLKNLDTIKVLNNHNKKISFGMILLCCLFFSKSFTYFKYSDLFINKKNEFNYSNHIEKIGTYDGVDFYKSTIWQCAELKEICVNTVKENYKIDKILNYNVYKSE